MLIKKLAGLMVLAAMFVSTNAMAVPISGQIGFGGDWTRSGNTIDFIGTPSVEMVNGDLASTISFNDVTTFNDLTFNPFVPTHTLWDLGGFTFALQTVNTIFDNGAQFIILQGTGVISGNGFDATTTSWDLSSNNLTFSTSNVTQDPVAVPEPATMMLLGLGMLGLVGAKRRNS